MHAPPTQPAHANPNCPSPFLTTELNQSASSGRARPEMM